MSAAASISALLLSMQGLEVAPPAKGSPEQRAVFERSQTRQRNFEQSLFVRAGFAPLERVAAEGRSVRRVLFQDPYRMLPVPAIEVELHPGDRATVTIVHRDGRRETASLPAGAWERLRKMEGKTFVPKEYVPWEPQTSQISRGSSVCHGRTVRFGSAGKEGTGSGSWSQCGGAKEERYAYAVEMARLAVSTNERCTFDASEPFFSVRACFSQPPAPQVDPGSSPG